ncbi:MAG: hypothetical protein AAGE52_00520 [Myxococcota bacterium]
MSAALSAGLMGLALGVRHAFEPDHLAAVGTFVPQNTSPRRAAAMGALWGSGHALALIAFGGVLLSFRAEVPSWLDATLEGSVGVILIVLGLRTMRRSRTEAQKTKSRWRPFTVGVAHGAAGTGAAVLLASAAMNSTGLGILFLGLFGVGATVGMAAIAGLVGVPVHRAPRAIREGWITMGLGAISIGIGIWWLINSLMA